MKQHLSLPFPPSPILEDAVGYKKDNPELKYLGMWWEPCGDEAIISDGKITFTGNWAGYLAYVNNPRVKPLLENVNLGWSDEAAEYALLFDFESNSALVMDLSAARKLLQDQWERGTEVISPVSMSVEEMEEFVRKLTESYKEVSVEEVRLQMIDDQKKVEKLTTWLNAQMLPLN